MNLVQESSGKVVVVALAGAVDSRNQNTIKSEIKGCIPDIEEPLVLVDLSAVESLDSSGLAVFISVGREVHERHGQLKFCSLSKPIESLFKVTRLYLAFETYSTRERALESF